MLLNGDTMYQAKLEEILSERDKQKADILICAFKSKDTKRYAPVEELLDSTSNNTMEDECWVNAGAYVINPEILQVIKKDIKSCSLEREVIPEVNKSKMCVGYAKIKAGFIDIGIPTDFMAAQNSELFKREINA